MEHDPYRFVSSVLARVVPSAEGGASVLATGATAALRRAHLDALATSLEELRGPAPLVVRIGPPRGGPRLPEVVSDAVEASLVARRAPGGLYEDQGDEVLRSLGSWLFRARSVGCEGIVLLIDELDAWLDARGRRDALAPWFGAILAECPRRSLSVVASVRAATASGAPSLPQDLAARFAEHASLGGPPAVLARDPSTLVAAFAGRTFSRASLRAGLDAWLDLPGDGEGDDALIVFTSPLAPPALPTVHGAPLPWTPAPAPPSQAPSLRVDGRPATAADLARWGATLVASVELGAAVRAARALSVHDRESAEAAFRSAYARIPRRAERLAAGVEGVGAESPRLLEAAAVAIERFDGVVRALAAQLPADEPSLDALHELCAAHASSSAARTSATLALTGLRADLGETFIRELVRTLPGARLAAQGVRWTAPASPERARALADVIARTPWEDAVHPQREHAAGREIYRVAAYAKVLGSGGRSLDEVAATVEAAVLPALAAWRAGLAGPVALLILSDVGAGALNPRGERALGDGTAHAQLLPWWIVTVGVAA